MNNIRLASLLACSLLATACGSDSNNSNDGGEIAPPPVDTAIDIDKATSIQVELIGFEGVSGALSFNLSDNEQQAITQAKDYKIIYFGFPEQSGKINNPKGWQRWHLTNSYSCNNQEKQCEGILTESETKGNYTFEAPDLDWSRGDSDGVVTRYKVAIEIKGALSSNEVALLPPL
ncbi:hypothetical protein K0625_05000 [Shewanella sp. NR704-98]|uniref:Lipoprotein n=2 Tax=Shewanella nanhaiensis TaxID=2864872 RepID=A0ABS7E0Y7_9GAMM|nr:hypothetical protein [Shewanella nanhaiensis]